MTEYASNGVTHAYASGDESGQKADFRVRIFDAEDNGSNWSPLLNVPSLAIDNTAPAAPTFSAVFGSAPATINFSGFAPDSLNVAYMTCTGTGAPTIDAIRPGEAIPAWTYNNFTSANNIGFSVTPRATNGTGGPTKAIRYSYASTVNAPTIAAVGVVGSGRIDVKWLRGTGPTTYFTGPGAPADSADDNGEWSATGLSPGMYTITATDGVTPSSIDITI